MKKMPIRLAAIGEPTTPCDSLLDLQPVFERLIDALADRLQGDQRRRVLSLGRALDGPFGDGEREVQLIVAQAERLLFLSPQFLPLARSCAKSISRRPSSTSRSGGTASKTKPHFAASLGADGLARQDHFDGC